MRAFEAQAELLRMVRQNEALASALAAHSAFRTIDVSEVLRNLEALSSIRAGIQEFSGFIGRIAAAAASENFRAVDMMRPKLMDLLPDITALVVQAREFREVQESLEAAGLDALVEPFPVYLFRGLVGVDEQVRSAWLTNRLLHFSKTDEFASELESSFRGSVTLRHRWPVVAEALAVHRERRYLLSIPVLLATTEGVVGDALVLKGIVRPLQGKLYIKDEGGRRAKNKKGEYLTISGAHDLADRAKKLDHSTLNGVADYITTVFVGIRNPILHGRKVNYRSPKLSVQSLFALYVLSGAIEDFEKGD